MSTAGIWKSPWLIKGGAALLNFKGNWDANTNTPTLASGVGINGDVYRVSADGSTNLDGVTDWKVGDWAYFNGTVWQKGDNTDAVASVFGRIGVVVAASNDYTWNQINKTVSDIANITTKSHTSLTDKGVKTHATLDTEVDANNAHRAGDIIARTFAINGQGFAITSGYKGHIKAPFPNCDIVRIDMESAGGVGNTTTVIDIWKCTQAQYDDNVSHPVDGDSITASAQPTITTAIKMTDSTLTGWTKTGFITGDCFGINVDSNDVAKLLIVTIYFQWKPAP